MSRNSVVYTLLLQTLERSGPTSQRETLRALLRRLLDEVTTTDFFSDDRVKSVYMNDLTTQMVSKILDVLKISFVKCVISCSVKSVWYDCKIVYKKNPVLPV